MLVSIQFIHIKWGGRKPKNGKNEKIGLLDSISVASSFVSEKKRE